MIIISDVKEGGVMLTSFLYTWNNRDPPVVKVIHARSKPGMLGQCLFTTSEPFGLASYLFPLPAGLAVRVNASLPQSFPSPLSASAELSCTLYSVKRFEFKTTE